MAKVNESYKKSQKEGLYFVVERVKDYIIDEMAHSSSFHHESAGFLLRCLCWVGGGAGFGA